MPTPNAQELRKFMDALAKVESGGEEDPYRARGPAETRWGRAMGRYQMMSEIWPSWAAEIGYDGLTQQQFLDNPHVQDAIAAHKMRQYYDKYGDWNLVAAAWFGGDGAAKAIRDNGMQAVAGWSDGFNSVPDYVEKVMSGFGPAGGEVSRPSTSQPLTSREVVEQAMEGIPGLQITSTYRDPEKNKAVGGSETSWHLNEDNPAVDVSGPRESMEELHRRLKAMNLDAELLWDSEGHQDHVHFALRAPVPADQAMVNSAKASAAPTRSPQRNTVQAMMNRLSDMLQRNPGDPQMHEAVRRAMQEVIGSDPGKTSATQRSADVQQQVRAATENVPTSAPEERDEVPTETGGIGQSGVR